MTGFLERTTSGVVRKALKVVIFGEPGVGKTTFASQAPNPYFIGAEDGSNNLNVSRFSASSWSEIIGVIDELATREHPFKTVVLDSANWAQKMCFDHISNNNNVDSIEKIGYGKGYVYAQAEFEKLIGRFERLVSLGINVVVIAHDKITRFDNPAGESYSVYTLATDDKRITPILTQWPDAVLFAAYDKSVMKADKSGDRKIAKSYGDRIMFTENRASHLAKNRYSLPERLPLSWKSFSDCVDYYFNQFSTQDN